MIIRNINITNNSWKNTKKESTKKEWRIFIYSFFLKIKPKTVFGSIAMMITSSLSLSYLSEKEMQRCLPCAYKFYCHVFFIIINVWDQVCVWYASTILYHYYYYYYRLLLTVVKKCVLTYTHCSSNV